MEIPEVRYARTVDGVHIAYQVAGDGPLDLVIVASGLGLGRIWNTRRAETFPGRYAGFSRLILLDRRGTGLSDHVVEREHQNIESHMDDVRAVMDAAGSERAVLLGFESGFAVAAMFAATFPERTIALISFGSKARELWAPDYPFGRPAAEFDAELLEIERDWATPRLAQLWLSVINPEAKDDPWEIEDFIGWMQAIGGPGDAMRWAAVDRDIDLRDLLPSIRVPTLVLHRTDDMGTTDRTRPLPRGEHPRGGAARAARHQPHVGPERGRAVRGQTLHDDDPSGTGSVRSLPGHGAVHRHRGVHRHRLGGRGRRVAGPRRTAPSDRAGALARFRGTEMDTAGDGFFATFDGPARAVRCAMAIADAVRGLSLDIRAGVHTGEVQTIDGKAGGIAVTIGSRIMSQASASEVLVSRTVKDLVAGSGLTFEDTGEHELKGVPDLWHLYRVVD